MKLQRQAYGCSITAPLLSSSKWPSPKAHFSSTPPFSRRIRRNYTPVYWGARSGLCARTGWVLPLFFQYTGGKGADDEGFVRRVRRWETCLRRAKGLSPSALPACCRRTKQQWAIGTDKARRTPIYGPAGVLYAGGRLFLDPSKDSRAQRPSRTTDLCRPARIDEAPAHVRRHCRLEFD